MIVTEVSFEECFREHYPRLVAIGIAMTGSRETARELAQETFVRLHDHWDTVGGYDKPGAWLRRVMSNLLIDEYRSQASERRAVDRLAGSAATHTEPTEVGDEWSDLVAELPPRQRLIVTLYYGEDRSVADIADTLDISPNSVKSALSKARDTLRTRWEQHDE